MSFWQEVVNLLFPPACVCCGELIDATVDLCHACEKKWDAWRAHRCPKCGHPAPVCNCLPSRRRSRADDRIFYAFFYDSHDEECIANRLIYGLKQENDRHLIRFLASCLANTVISSARMYGIDLSEYKITYPPRSWWAKNRYGFDHTRLLAHALSQELGIPVIKTLTRSGIRVQKTLTAKKRYENAARSYRVAKNTALNGQKLILLDDVITSGATLTVCEALLYTAGAEDVLLCALAKDI
ncbi:MAG: ComF family protein [Clostridia bacterium]|nr:ComF family protein [Clostridia bacterium]